MHRVRQPLLFLVVFTGGVMTMYAGNHLVGVAVPNNVGAGVDPGEAPAKTKGPKSKKPARAQEGPPPTREAPEQADAASPAVGFSAQHGGGIVVATTRTPQRATPAALTWQAAADEANGYTLWRPEVMEPSDGINRAEPLLELVRPLSTNQLQIVPDCADLAARWVPSDSPAKRGKVSTAGSLIVRKIQTIMSELDCVWWLTNGGPLQLARGDDMTDPDFDVRVSAALCRRALHYCTTD